MAFRGEIHHHVGMLFLKQLIHALTVADIQLYEPEIGVTHHRLQSGQVARVGQLVQANDSVIRVFFQHMENKIGPDKSGAAGHNDVHSQSSWARDSRYCPYSVFFRPSPMARSCAVVMKPRRQAISSMQET